MKLIKKIVVIIELSNKYLNMILTQLFSNYNIIFYYYIINITIFVLIIIIINYTNKCITIQTCFWC